MTTTRLGSDRRLLCYSGRYGKGYTIPGDFIGDIQTELDQIAQLDTYPSIGSGNLKKEVITQNGETTTYDSENEDQAEDVAAVAGGLGAVKLSEAADYSVDDADLAGYWSGCDFQNHSRSYLYKR